MLDFSKASTQMMRRLFAILCLPWQLQLSLCLSLDGINSRESKGGKLKPELQINVVRLGATTVSWTPTADF
jgi:hypothetical protein